MATEIELAILAYDAYRPSQRNSILPMEWAVESTEDQATGFGASVYKRGDEVVIAFRGTDDRKSVEPNFTRRPGRTKAALRGMTVYRGVSIMSIRPQIAASNAGVWLRERAR